MNAFLLLSSPILLLWSPVASAAEVSGSASGFGEIRGVWSPGVDGKQVQLVERFRPTFEASFGDKFELVTTIELGFAQGRRLQDEFQRTLDESALHEEITTPGGSVINPLWDSLDCSWPDGPVNDTLNIDGLKDYARVDRLYGDIYLGDADVRVGRQAVQWGNALLVHPADPFPEVLFLEPWRPRAGVNAARLNYQLDDTQSLTVLAGMDDTLRFARVAGKVTTNVKETDLSLIGAWRQESSNGFVGVDIKGTAEVGFWFEGSWHVEGRDPTTWPPRRPGIGGDGGYEELATGIDYSLPIFQMFVIAAQYYRNGAGSPELGQAAAAGRFTDQLVLPECTDAPTTGLFAPSAADPFAPVFLGRDYGLFALQAVFNDRWSANGAMIQNLGDGSAMAVPTVGFKPSGWSELSLSAQVPFSTWGDGGELNPSDDDLTPALQVLDGEVPLDFTGLVPDATVILWTRASF